ncbi:4-hydroxythreonine-4-phosphate dehydrogenase PdxA [Mesohalobacter halotolerans]|uniref:4-hydroxythreonine-4-phosphate dehydrogenase PdxA n=1 Tax=Mesohalobacter halotolerans TaxID=1883405 RepID=A0A4U5TTV9_9FLAO|nr:4-hydroxythreonine-4-phosphate dehydrogenase PdxA [Mesohalobacter halotolerans]MBS3738986.1 4-hydroxythreonine-4-phosphate dehydrogenase PdxA [Psychroflexus sp.]TKS57676.1 4-hydroxythreonine-4-phosphate dehydrogenase PdxA [Mesohalobacter halotolerans]
MTKKITKSSKSLPKVGISIGDINGIGSEIILKTFEDERMLEFCTPVIFAHTKMLSFLKRHFKLNLKFQGVKSSEKIIEGKINVVNSWKNNPKIEFGQEHKAAGVFAIKSLRSATNALKAGHVDVLVTAPIHKNSIQADDFKFPGHTDFLEQELGGNALMFMVSDPIKVGLLTDHVPVKDISKHITPDRIKQKINTVKNSLKQDYQIDVPKIAVLGINPHTGDNGVIGKEDDDIIRPTLSEINKTEPYVFGPYAADSFFGSKNYKNFDAIVAAYHDQGLIPFKTLSFGHGVNFTAGLNYIRTSPDHGTGFDIAGQGKADPSSFTKAVFEAIKINNNRTEYKQLTKNPLKVK